jgi:hypothetical protein
MAKQINSLILETATTSTSTKTSPLETKGEKTESSLFDSLLKNNFSNIDETSKTTINEKKQSPTNISQNISNNGNNELKVNSVDETVKTQNLNANVSTQETSETKVEIKSSLLDKLVSEAKKDISSKNNTVNTNDTVNIKEEHKNKKESLNSNTEVKKLDISSSLNNLEAKIVSNTSISETKEEIKTENTQVKVVDNNKNTQAGTLTSQNIANSGNTQIEVNNDQKLVKTPNVNKSIDLDEASQAKVESKQLLSDKFTQEISKDITSQNNTQSINIKVDQKEPSQIESKEVKIVGDELNKNQTISQPVKDLSTNQNIGVKLNNEEVNNKTQDLNTDIDNELENPKVETKSSLLDKLIVEAKKDIDSNNNTKDINNIIEVQEDNKIIKEGTDSNIETKKVDINLTLNNEEAKKVADSANKLEDNKIIKEGTDSNIETKKVDINLTLNNEEAKNIADSLDTISEEKKIDNAQLKVVEDNNNKTQVLTESSSKVIVDNIRNESKENSNNETLKTQVISSTDKVEVKSSNTNEEVAKAFDSLNGVDSSSTENTVNISKEELLKNKKVDDTAQKNNSTLMDQLIQKNRQLVFGNEITSSQKQTQDNDFLTSMYLGSQKNIISNQSLFNKNEAVSLASNANSIEEVKTSANMLDLGLEDIDIQKAVETVKKLDIDKLDRHNLLDKLAFNKNILNMDLRSMITSSIEASKALLEDTINIVDDMALNVNNTLVQSLQTKIVGARQQMGQMMSDVARQMYENYKPPVTAFRINLNPATLGAIAIVMRNDRDNGLTISMSVSSGTTLDAMIENQNSLRNSLNKLFDENTKFNLNFSSSSDNQSSNQNNQNNSSGQNLNNQEILKSIEENEIQEEKNTDYM